VMVEMLARCTFLEVEKKLNAVMSGNSPHGRLRS
jgi:hypothetical protein